MHRLQFKLLPFGNSESSFCVTYWEDDRNLKLTVCVVVQDQKNKKILYMRNFNCSCRFLCGEISVATTIKLLLCSDEASSVTGNIKINFGNTCLHIFDYVTKAFVPFSIKQVNHPLKMKMCTIE